MEKLTINGIGLTELGAILAPESYKSVLQWAKFKSIASNDWAEHNYAEYDLSKPTLDKRSVTLNFHAKGENGYRQVINYLLEYVYSFYEFPELGITLRMRVDGNSLSSIEGTWQSFSVNFVDDAPYRQQAAVVSLQNFKLTGYTLDGTDLAKYGIAILKGTLQSVIPKSSVKERLTISENSMDGAFYDSRGVIRLKPQSITLKCLLRAQTLPVAVANFFYLLELFKQSGKRRIFVEILQDTIDCFYSSCTVGAVHKQLNSGNAGIAFDITVNVIKRNVTTVLGSDDLTKALVKDTELETYLIGD